MKRIKWLMPVLAVMLMLIACNKDEDSSDILPLPEKPETTAPMEVAIVFEPGQLGSMCTNDYLLKDVEDMANAYPDSLVSTFICRSNYSETNQAIKTWASQAYGADERRHRLLILSDPALAYAMDGVQLQPTDHLLMLKTRLDDARKLGLDGRTHVLNVSCANAIRQAIEYWHQQYLEVYADTIASVTQIENRLRITRLNRDVNYGDSIIETLLEMFPEKKVGIALYVEWNDIGIDGLDLKAMKSPYDSEMFYLLAFLSVAGPDPLSRIDQGILTEIIEFTDWGAFNRSYEWFWLTHRDTPSFNILIGEYDNNNLQLDYIVPRYELKSWLTRWMNHPDNMPEEEWSGKAIFSPWRERF